LTRPQPDAVSPAPLPKDADVPAPASIEETHQSEGARYRRRVILVLSGIVVTLLSFGDCHFGINLRRATPVAQAGFVSRQALETAAAQAHEAKAALADAEVAISKAQQVLALHQAAVASIGAEIATLQWQLDQTKLLAPADGTVTQLTLRVGDQGVANAPLIGLVDAHAWRIYANYKEGVIRHMKVGHTAWVWLDAYPWHIHKATIQGIARGISREQIERKLLPYVEPTTDWIRLERRFPVTLVLQDLSPDVVLHMGSDARAFIFY